MVHVRHDARRRASHARSNPVRPHDEKDQGIIGIGGWALGISGGTGHWELGTGRCEARRIDFVGVKWDQCFQREGREGLEEIG